MTGGGGAPGLTEGDGWALLVDGWRAGLMLATALLLVQSARALAGDRETGVFRLAVTRSASRSGAVVGRALMGPVLTLVMVLFAGGGALLAATALGADFGDLVEDDYKIFSAFEVREELHRALVGAFIAMIAVHGFGLLVSSASRGSSSPSRAPSRRSSSGTCSRRTSAASAGSCSPPTLPPSPTAPG